MKRPFKSKNTTVAIVGFAATSREMAPYNKPGVDIWGLNEAYKYPWFKSEKPGAWFQLHPKWDFMRKNNRNDPKHWEWLQEEHPFPIFMFDRFLDVPASVRYPIEDAISKFGMYLTSSISYMIAAAILYEYQRIEIYGVEMSSDSEYYYQKPGAEYLLGFARGMGIEIGLPENCGLLRGNLYGYEDLRAADRTYFSQRITILEGYQKDRERELFKVQGRLAEIDDLMHSPDAGKAMADRRWFAERFMFLQAEKEKAIYEHAVMAGAVDELNSVTIWHDSQSIPADRKDVKDEQAQQTPVPPTASA